MPSNASPCEIWITRKPLTAKLAKKSRRERKDDHRFVLLCDLRERFSAISAVKNFFIQSPENFTKA
jgi:hypothetical protein